MVSLLSLALSLSVLVNALRSTHVGPVKNGAEVYGLAENRGNPW